MTSVQWSEYPNWEEEPHFGRGHQWVFKPVPWEQDTSGTCRLCGKVVDPWPIKRYGKNTVEWSSPKWEPCPERNPSRLILPPGY